MSRLRSRSVSVRIRFSRSLSRLLFGVEVKLLVVLSNAQLKPPPARCTSIRSSLTLTCVIGTRSPERIEASCSRTRELCSLTLNGSSLSKRRSIPLWLAGMSIFSSTVLPSSAVRSASSVWASAKGAARHKTTTDAPATRMIRLPLSGSRKASTARAPAGLTPRPRRDTIPAGMNGGELIGDVLQRQGVRSLFTLCGGHISPILVACKRRGIRVVDVRHEATAVFAADASARLSGVPGVAAVTAGPGATNTITALKNAQLAESPLVVLGGATATILKGRGSLQDIDQRALLLPHVKRFGSARRVRELVPELERAFREASAGVPGPAVVECPVDLLYDADTVRPWYGAKSAGDAHGLSEKALHWYLRRHLDDLFAGASDQRASDAVAVPAPSPDADAVERAARLLSRAERPVVLVGSQALLSPREVPALVAALEAVAAPVYLSGMARGLLGPAHPLQVRHRRKEALREADLVVLAGTPCDFRLDYGRQLGKRTLLVSANRSSRALRKNRRPDVAALGAPELFLRALAGTAAGRPRFGAWLEALRGRDAERDREIEAQGAHAVGQGVHPIALLRALERALPDDSVIVADGGDFVATASYVLRPRRPLSWLDPGVFGTLGVGGGFALGARLQRPDAELFVLYGDGSLGYSLMELDTFARHGLGVVAIVGNDASWAQIAREQVEVLKDDVGTVLAPTDYHRAAEGLGAKGYALDRIEDAESVLAAARADARGGRPVLINARLAKSAFRK